MKKNTNTNITKKLAELEARVKNLEEFTSINIKDDKLIEKAKEIIREYEKVSASLIQRRLKIGYSRAARILDELEKNGYVSKGLDGNPRKVIKK